MDDREHEIREVRGDAEKFLAPVLPLLQAWRESLALQGITLSHDLFVGPYPVNAPQNPVKAGLHVQVKGVERYTWGTVFVLDYYQPEHADWLAAEIEFAIEEELAPEHPIP